MVEGADGYPPSGVIPIGIFWITVCVCRRCSWSDFERLALTFSVSQDLARQMSTKVGEDQLVAS